MKISVSIGEVVELLLGKPKRVTRRRRDESATILMAQTAFNAGIYELARRKPEAGGILLGPRGHRAVTHFIPDESGRSTTGSFTWDHLSLNAILKQAAPLALEGRGFWHSHPPGHTELSAGDLEYVRKVILAPGNSVDEVLMPIFTDGECYPFIVYPDLRVAKAKIVLF